MKWKADSLLNPGTKDTWEITSKTTGSIKSTTLPSGGAKVGDKWKVTTETTFSSTFKMNGTVLFPSTPFTSTETQNFTAVAQETVTTPAGTFETWKIREDEDKGDYTLRWWSAKAKMDVKSESYDSAGVKGSSTSLKTYSVSQSPVGGGGGGGAGGMLSGMMLYVLIGVVIAVVAVVVVVMMARKKKAAAAPPAQAQQPGQVAQPAYGQQAPAQASAYPQQQYAQQQYPQQAQYGQQPPSTPAPYDQQQYQQQSQQPYQPQYQQQNPQQNQQQWQRPPGQ